MRRLALLLLAGCAGGSSYKAAAAPPGVSSSGETDAGPLPADPHARITALAQQIDIDLAAQNTTKPDVLPCSGASCRVAAAQPMALAPRADNACHPAPTDTCKSTCTLGDSICANAEKICKLADQLPGDDWAANHCATAKASCGAAHDRCCTCTA